MLVDLGRNDVGKVMQPHHGQSLNALLLAVFQVLLSWSMCLLLHGKAHSLRCRRPIMALPSGVFSCCKGRRVI